MAEKTLMELQAELEKCEKAKFFNDMVDTWGPEEYAFENEIVGKINDLKEQIKELEDK